MKSYEEYHCFTPHTVSNSSVQEKQDIEMNLNAVS